MKNKRKIENFVADVMELAVAVARDCGVEGEAMSPTFILEDKSGRRIAFAYVYDEEDKGLAIKQLRRTLRDAGPERVAMILEGWMADLSEGVLPSEHPKRREAIVVHAVSREEKNSMVQYVHRSDAGEMILEERVPNIEDAKSVWLDDLFQLDKRQKRAM